MPNTKRATPHYDNHLDLWMERAGMTPSEVAVAAGIAESRISKIRNRKGAFNASTSLGPVAKAIADRVPGASVGDVLTGLVCPAADDWCPPAGGGGE